jgi:hypothetical protein
MELDDKTCSNDVITQRANCFVQVTEHQGDQIGRNFAIWGNYFAKMILKLPD